MADRVAVRVRDCPDGSHPDGDEVFLAAKISLEGGLAAQQAVAALGDDGDALTRAWLVTFVRYGAVGWTIHEPFSIEALLDDYDLAEPVAERAAELYAEAVMRPLLRASERRLPTGSTTSSTRRRGTSRRSSSAPSSPAASEASTPSGA